MAYMVVAHPDDETIFGGGFLQNNPGTHVLCMTNRFDTVRQLEFRRAMKLFECSFTMFEFYDDANVDLPHAQMKSRIQSVIHFPAYVVTHAADGEYGHRHHINVHNAIRSLTNQFYVFGRGERLPEHQIDKKKEVLAVYASQVTAFPSLMDFIENEKICQYPT